MSKITANEVQEEEIELHIYLGNRDGLHGCNAGGHLHESERDQDRYGRAEKQEDSLSRLLSLSVSVSLSSQH
jgi:hypothetical protein